MDTLTPIAVIQNENMHIHKGKGAVEGGARPDIPKPSRPGHQKERKALRDLSHSGKPLLSALKSSSALKDKSAARSRDTAKKALPKAKILNEDLDKCPKWAEEGVERMPYYDAQKHEREEIEKRVEKKVQKAMSSLRGWTDMTFYGYYGLGMPMKESPSDIEEVYELEIEPEVLLPSPSRKTNLLLSSVDEEIEDLLDLKQIEDLHFEHLYCNKVYELKLKEEYE